MNRRRYLALVGAGATALAGCSDNSPNATPTGSTTQTDTATATATPTDSPTPTAESAAFELVGVDAPDAVDAGTEATYTVTVANTGGQRAALQTEVRRRTGDGDAGDSNTLEFGAVDPGSEAAAERVVSSPDPVRYVFELPEFGYEWSIEFLSTTPSPAEETRSALEDARTALNEALEMYADAAGSVNTTLTSVDLGTAFDANLVSEPLSRAQSALSDAAATATDDQQETVDQLRGVRLWIQRVADAQEAASGSYNDFTELQAAVHETRGNDIQTRADRLADTASAIENQLNIATDAAAPEDFESLSTPVEIVRRKLDQLQSIAGGYRTLTEQSQYLRQAVTRLAAAIDDYAAEEYTQAGSEWVPAAEGCFEAARAFENPSGETAVQELLSDWSCSFGALDASIEDMRTSTEHGQDGDDARRQNSLERAKDHLSGCGGSLDAFAVVESLRNLR